MNPSRARAMAGSNEPPPRQATLIHPGAVQPGHRAGHADRGVAVVVAPGVIDAAGHEHLGGRGGGCGLAEVVGGRGAVGRAVHQEPAAADVPRGRVGDRQHEGGGDRRVHGRAARPQRLYARFRGQWVRGDHHAAFRPRRRGLGAGGRCAGEPGGRKRRRRRRVGLIARSLSEAVLQVHRYRLVADVLELQLAVERRDAVGDAPARGCGPDPRWPHPRSLRTWPSAAWPQARRARDTRICLGFACR